MVASHNWHPLRLKSVKDDDGSTYYSLYVKILDAANHGLPQSRRRLFIMGFRKKLMKAPFKWPKPQKMVHLETILQKNVVGGGRLSA